MTKLIVGLFSFHRALEIISELECSSLLSLEIQMTFLRIVSSSGRQENVNRYFGYSPATRAPIELAN
jgi:hypothetical protein